MNWKLKKSPWQFHRGKEHISRRPYIVPIAGLIFALLVVGAVALTGQKTINKPSDKHVVFLYDRGKRQTLDTKAATVGNLISRLPLHLVPEDVVEPSPDTPISVDSFRVNIYRARPVTVIDNGQRSVTLTAQRSARTVAESAGLNVVPEDKVGFGPGSLRENVIGEKVVVERSTPVFFNFYGTPSTIHTFSKSVGELLKERNIKLGTGDSVQPDKKTPVTASLQVFLIRKGVQIKTVEEVVPAPVQNVADPGLTSGTTALRQHGADGKRLVTYQIQTTNGKETERQVIQSVVTLAPVPKIIVVGSKPFSGSLQDWLYKLRMCESHGNYQTNTGNGYYGAYQFSISTWNSLGTGYERADLAPPAVQDQAIIVNTNRSSGGLAGQNPGCYHSTGISAFPPSNR